MSDTGFTTTSDQLAAVGGYHNAWLGFGLSRREGPDGSLGVYSGMQIEKGTCICVEAPLISTEGEVNFAMVYKAVLNLKERDRDDYLYEMSWDQAAKADIIDSIKTFIDEEPEKAAICPELSEATLEEAALAVAVFDWNCRQRPGTNVHDVVRMISWINHSCSPNAVLSYNSARGKWLVHAIRKIHTGSEVFISFVPPHLPHSRRQIALRDANIYNCLCSDCPRLGEEFYFPVTESESSRMLLERCRTSILAATPEQNDQIMGWYQVLLNTLSSRPKFSEFHCQIYRSLAECQSVEHTKQSMTDALASIESAMELAITCYGLDGDLTLSLLQDYEDMKAEKEAKFPGKGKDRA